MYTCPQNSRTYEMSVDNGILCVEKDGVVIFSGDSNLIEPGGSPMSAASTSTSCSGRFRRMTEV